MKILRIYNNVLIHFRDFSGKSFFNGKVFRNYFSYLFSILLFTNCATIIKGPTEEVAFTSEPEGAKVIIADSLRGKTPLKLKLKSANDYSVKMELDTNKSYVTSLESSFAAKYLLGDIFFFPTSILVDWLSKSWWELDKRNIHAVFTDTSAYERDTTFVFGGNSNDFEKRLFLEVFYGYLFYGYPFNTDGYEINFSGTYMFSENWGVSAGYFNTRYDPPLPFPLMIGIEEISKIESIYLQAYVQREIFRNTYIYLGLGISYATVTGEVKYIFQPTPIQPSTEKAFVPSLKVGFKYEIFENVLISLGLSTTIGVGLSYVF